MTNAEYILATRLTLLQNDKLEKDTDSCEAHEAFHELCTATARCRFTPAAILARANTCDVTNETVVTFFYTCQSGTATTYDWQQALEQADNKNFAGFSDWRLPNKKELWSIVALDRKDPAINSAIFPNTPTPNFWSSSPFSNNNVWVQYFDTGYTGAFRRINKAYVRLVRGGQ